MALERAYKTSLGQCTREAKGLLRDQTSERSGREGDNKAETSGGE